jgi:SnoaL-like domain
MTRREKFIALLLSAWLGISQPDTRAQTPTLPAPAQCFFDTLAAENLEAFAECFAENAVVIDATREIRGRVAIRAWANNEIIHGQYAILEVEEIRDGVRIFLRYTPGGVGDGFRVRYDLKFEYGKIVNLTLRPAP